MFIIKEMVKHVKVHLDYGMLGGLQKMWSRSIDLFLGEQKEKVDEQTIYSSSIQHIWLATYPGLLLGTVKKKTKNEYMEISFNRVGRLKRGILTPCNHSRAQQEEERPLLFPI